MKKQFLFIIFIFSFLQQSFSQNPLVKQWDKRFGGIQQDQLACFLQTTDGGYIIGGHSYSGIGGDKTQLQWGGADYWIVKTDSIGNKQWDKNFGGTHWERFTSLQQTSDGGYILGGYSHSGISGDKTQGNWDTICNPYCGSDYWIVKTDSLGNIQWNKRFGGTDWDDLTSLQQTSDGGYILGGTSLSGISGDKTQSTWGGTLDFWILKTDSLGNKEWDKDFGGLSSDYLNSVLQTSDGGYILGGTSYSGIGGDKTQDNWDTSETTPDYWIVKIDSVGNKQWDKNLGGTDEDQMAKLQQTTDGGYILGGFSFSGIGGDKTQATWNSYDYWIIKTDSFGNKQWDRDLGGMDFERLFNLMQTADGGYLLGGISYSGIGGDKTESNLSPLQTWIIKTDSFGFKQWDKTLHTIPFGFQDEGGCAIETKDGCFAMANFTYSGVGGDKTQPSQGQQDYWIIKFCDTTSTTSITQLPDYPNTFSIYPNPANDYVIINYQFKAGDEIRLTDVLGKLLFTTKIKTPSSDFRPDSYRVPASDLSPGIYFIKAGNEVRKFVKE